MIFREVAIDGRLLSRLALGTHKFARSGQELNTRLLDTFFEAGGNVIDTGRCYQNGESARFPIRQGRVAAQSAGAWARSGGKP